MKSSTFWIGLIILNVILIPAIIGVHSFEIIREYSGLSFLSLIFFVVISILLFYLGKSAVRSKNKYAFIQLVIASVLFKILITVALVVAYVKIVNPESKYFVLPFVFIYLVFNIFETYVLYRIALTKTSSDHE